MKRYQQSQPGTTYSRIFFACSLTLAFCLMSASIANSVVIHIVEEPALVTLYSNGSAWDKAGVGDIVGGKEPKNDGTKAEIQGEWAEYFCHVEERWKPWIYKIDVEIQHYKASPGACRVETSFTIFNERTGALVQLGDLVHPSSDNLEWKSGSVEGDLARDCLPATNDIYIRVTSPDCSGTDAKVTVALVRVKLHLRRPGLFVSTTSLDLGDVYFETSNPADSTATTYNKEHAESFTIRNSVI